jgi:hypothetical protein
MNARNDPTPPVFVSADSKGVAGEFSVSADSKGVISRIIHLTKEKVHGILLLWKASLTSS